MPGGRAAHGAAVLEEQDVGGIEEEGVHTRRPFGSGSGLAVAVREGDRAAEADDGFDGLEFFALLGLLSL